MTYPFNMYYEENTIDRDQLMCAMYDAGYEAILERPENKLVRFAKDDTTSYIDVWYSTGTVGIQRNGNTRYVRDMTIDKITAIDL